MDDEKEWKKFHAFCVQFYDNGEESVVIVDDLVPTSHGTPTYGRSTNPKEFWVTILEKAYAKKYGSYSIIEGGHTSKALAELTNGVPSIIRNSD